MPSAKTCDGMLHVQSAIAARKQEIERGEISPLCKPIAFDHRFCVAPMVGQSDLAFRLLCLRHGASCCWTEVLMRERVRVHA